VNVYRIDAIGDRDLVGGAGWTDSVPVLTLLIGCVTLICRVADLVRAVAAGDGVHGEPLPRAARAAG
jgi:hypothetical protein